MKKSFHLLLLVERHASLKSFKNNKTPQFPDSQCRSKKLKKQKPSS